MSKQLCLANPLRIVFTILVPLFCKQNRGTLVRRSPGSKKDVTVYVSFSPPPNSRARSGTVSLAIVHWQADKHCSLTRELKVPPIHFVAEGHLLTLLRGTYAHK